MKRTFLLCGSIGWCLEILWTGSHSLFAGETTMMGKTSLLMFPIYGCASLIGPVSQKISALPVFLRGCLYTAGIFAAEYSSGSLLKHFHMCPWDYTDTPFHYKGLIRLDYAPLWFATGLLFEKILAKSS
ncbi:MAG TPA: putative ABC transporter permease [Candidatus Blautia faecigallinarum]|uniref:ABC transporter permease n=1 Tax=Candidatus Blautia faecigallinarum TaxID=2838488 RepID=A0A9D2IUL1_9FIRM|nr:putative ABC transporter permease [Candidatus Blautia faecigallinarum]